MIGNDRQPVPLPIESHLRRLIREDTVREQEHRQRIEKLALNRAVERTSAVLCRVPNGLEEVLGVFVEVEFDLPVGQTFLNFLQADVDDLANVLVREGALEKNTLAWGEEWKRCK